MDNMQSDLKRYEEIAKSMNRLDVYNANKDFFIEMISTQHQLEKLRGSALIQVNKKDHTLQRPTAAAKLIVKLKRIYAEYQKQFNKLMGISTTGKTVDVPKKDNWLEEFKERHNIS